MSSSPLAEVTMLSPNHSGRRNHIIDTVSIHCMGGNISVERCGEIFMQPNRKASSNYGIGSDGRIALYVDESNRSWCTSSSSNDNRAVTIEVANDGGADTGWHISGKAYNSLINLLADICKRNNIPKLLWRGDKSLIGQTEKQNMTVHRWFAAKSCPGDYLYNLHSKIAEDVNKKLYSVNQEDENMTLDKFKELMRAYRSELQDNDCGDWSEDARKWAVNNGLIAGIGTDVNGNPNYAWADTLTREQMAVLLYRFTQMIGGHNEP